MREYKERMEKMGQRMNNPRSMPKPRPMPQAKAYKARWG
jgi:hypothetical protein